MFAVLMRTLTQISANTNIFSGCWLTEIGEQPCFSDPADLSDGQAGVALLTRGKRAQLAQFSLFGNSAEHYQGDFVARSGAKQSFLAEQRLNNNTSTQKMLMNTVVNIYSEGHVVTGLCVNTPGTKVIFIFKTM